MPADTYQQYCETVDLNYQMQDDILLPLRRLRRQGNWSYYHQSLSSWRCLVVRVLVAGRRIQESTKSVSKTVAKSAEQRRRRELAEGFNSFEDVRRSNVMKFLSSLE
jgi:hypothetical protein